ncbi:MAG: molybdate ABC transporter substrate-binding protein [Proteobacteria bacterium]|nr:molybdate ABC transporter substrate-binding protein [Pseudomonadota bacterium]
MITRAIFSSLVLLFFSVLPLNARADGGVITVAVASNALRPLSEIAGAFEESSGVKVRIVHGSTGKLYAQITQGAPFDIFLSADRLRPSLLIEKGFAKAGSSFTYAKGVLALWTSRKDLKLAELGLEVFYDQRVKKIAIANPVTAPYGRAAMDVVIGGYVSKHGGRNADVERKIVYGESVSQAFSYARTGNADVAITSLSTIYGQSGESLEIDESFYSLIVQDGVILNDAAEETTAFKEFLFGKEATDIFIRYGYRVDG